MHLSLVIKSILLAMLLSIPLQAATSSTLELTPVKLMVDHDNRIHVSYQSSCGAEFAGFVLRTGEQKELQMGVILRRSHARCSELGSMQELIVPHLKASDFAGITSMNPNIEPIYLKTSPLQTINHVRKQEQTELQAAYTSQCGTPIGLFFQPNANAYRFGLLEGRGGKFGACNRSTKLITYPGLDFSRTSYDFVSSYDDEEAQPPYILKRVNTRLVYDKQKASYQVLYLRACNEAPIGIIRQVSSIAMLVAHYPKMPCTEVGPRKMWTSWVENLPAARNPVASLDFKAPVHEKLQLVRPLSYGLGTHKLEISSYKSCQKDLGLVSRSSRQGYAIGILQLQDSQPCNSPLKQVTYSYSWSFDDTSKRDVKPLQLVGL